MRFQFRLQTLLRLREAARDERREQLAEVMRIDDALRKQLAELEGLQSEARALQRLGVGRVDVDRLLEAQRYEAVVALEILHVERQRAAVAEEMNKRRDALVEADREFKVLEITRKRLETGNLTRKSTRIPIGVFTFRPLSDHNPAPNPGFLFQI